MEDEQLKTLHKRFIQSEGVSIDTRTLQTGQIFFALKGENFDGNKYAMQAIEKGASLVIVDDPTIDHTADDRVILVDDGLEALQKLANWHRRRNKAKVIALTGSNGKTTTKELLAEVLQDHHSIIYTQGNLNNHIGVPLSLLQIQSDTEIAIIEMGANHIGEIADLCQIAEPDEGLITNIGEAHLEGFGSIDGVRQGKGELYDYLRSHGGRIYLNTELEFLSDMIGAYDRVISYDTASIKQLSGIEILDTNDGIRLQCGEDDHLYACNLVGAYNHPNILVATMVGLSQGLSPKSICERISRYVPENKRSQKIVTDANTVILDAYNANPTSMRAALSSLSRTSSAQKKIAILGDMYELGTSSSTFHYEIARLAKEVSGESILVGKHFSSVDSSLTSFEDYEALEDFLKTQPIKGCLLLIKASRGMALERLLPLL